MELLTTIVVGLIVGAVARVLMPGDQRMGWIMTCLLGIGGSLLAGYAGQWMGMYAVGQTAGWFASIIGALGLLFVVGKLRGRTRTQ